MSCSGLMHALPRHKYMGKHGMAKKKKNLLRESAESGQQQEILWGGKQFAGAQVQKCRYIYLHETRR